MSEQPSTPTRDEHDNADFGPSADVGEGYPEESPEGANPDGVSQEPWDQPQRRRGGVASDHPNHDGGVKRR